MYVSKEIPAMLSVSLYEMGFELMLIYIWTHIFCISSFFIWIILMNNTDY